MILRAMHDTFHSLYGKKALVLGIGRTGLSVAKFLHAKGAIVTAMDALAVERLPRAGELKSLGIKVAAGGFVAEEFDRAELIVVSPGIDSRLALIKQAVEQGTEVLSDVELFYRLTELPIIAITGTNGKSTTTELISWILKRAGKKIFTGGNIGTPAFACLEQCRNGATYDMAVLEISSFHLELVETFNPHIAVLLNITEDHLDRYDSFEHYAKTKIKLLAKQTKNDYSVLNAADPVVASAIINNDGYFDSSVTLFSSAAGAAGGGVTQIVRNSGVYLESRLDAPPQVPGEEKRKVLEHIVDATGSEKVTYEINNPALTGMHNMENIMAAIAVARIAGVDSETILSSVNSFKGLPHRMEFVREIGGVSYINDSKSTNVGSLKKALQGVREERTVVLIAGGKDKGGDLSSLKELIRDKVKLLILIGQASGRMSGVFEHDVPTVEAGGLPEAVEIAALKAAAGDVVLLSPACSSFDMFRNFEHRGEEFCRLVRGLGQ